MVMIPQKKSTTAAQGVGPETESKKVSIPQKQTETAAQPQTETVSAATQTVQQPVQQASVPVVQQGGAVAAPRVARKMRDPLEENFKDKIPLEWNTLHRIQANQGNFLDLERNKQAIGGTLVVQLISYQPSWQLSPGTDDPADVVHVKYSDDGKTSQDGYDMLEYLQGLQQANYTKAKISARYMMAFVIEACPQDPSMVGKLVQIDMSESSKKSFDQFRMQLGFSESRGTITSEVAESGMMKLTTSVKTQKNFSWTVIQFESYIPQ